VKTIAFTMVAPSEEFFTFTARSISVPGEAGYLGVMPGHIPIIAKLRIGLVHIITANAEDLWFGVTGGFFEMMENHATLLADEIITPEESNDLAPIWLDRPVYFREKPIRESDRSNLAKALLNRKLNANRS
jgi:F-type H+-transporting ATPase subunit epsilon